MLSTVLSIGLVAVVALLGFAATRPAAFRIERAATIDATPEKVFFETGLANLEGLAESNRP